YGIVTKWWYDSDPTTGQRQLAFTPIEGGRLALIESRGIGHCDEWHSVKLNTLGFKVLRRKTPAHRLIINNMISISLDPKPCVSEAYSIFYIRISSDLS